MASHTCLNAKRRLKPIKGTLVSVRILPRRVRTWFTRAFRCTYLCTRLTARIRYGLWASTRTLFIRTARVLLFTPRCAGPTRASGSGYADRNARPRTHPWAFRPRPHKRGRTRTNADERRQAHALASLIGWKQDHRARTPTTTNERSKRVRQTAVKCSRPRSFAFMWPRPYARNVRVFFSKLADAEDSLCWRFTCETRFPAFGIC